jgi:hypothetical protein
MKLKNNAVFLYSARINLVEGENGDLLEDPYSF